MKCINCGNENNEDAKYCNKCGDNLREQVEESIIKTKTIKYEQSRENKFLILMISIVILIVFFTLIVAIFSKKSNLNVTINDTDTTEVSQETINSEEINQNVNESNTIINNKTNNQIRKLNVIDQSCTSILHDSFNKDYSPYQVLDGKKSTAWVEGVSGDGYGESITLYLGSIHNVKQLKIVNGLVNSSDVYNKNNRVGSLILSFSDGSSQIIYLEDQVTGYQTINLSTPVQTSYVTLTINDVYYGYKYNDTCISEVEIFGY